MLLMTFFLICHKLLLLVLWLFFKSQYVVDIAVVVELSIIAVCWFCWCWLFLIELLSLSQVDVVVIVVVIVIFCCCCYNRCKSLMLLLLLLMLIRVRVVLLCCYVFWYRVRFCTYLVNNSNIELTTEHVLRYTPVTQNFGEIYGKITIMTPT